MLAFITTYFTNSNKYIRYIPIINFLFIVVGVYALPLTFETNDDALMMLLASGQYTGTPEHFLVFINLIFGYTLSFFYSIFPQIQWYSVLFLMFHFISLNVLSKIILTQSHSLKAKFLFLSILYLIATHNIVSFQFTTTAAITALSGLILIGERNKKIIKLIGAFLFIVASLIRFEAAFLVLVVYSPQFYIGVLQFAKAVIRKRNNKLNSSFIGYLLVAVCSSVLLYFVHSKLCKDSALYSHYYNYNVIRGKIHDNPQAPRANDNLPTGISKLDFKLFNESIIDINILSINKIEEINQSINEVNFIEKVGVGLTNLYKHNAKFLICIICLVFIVIQINHAKSRKLIIALSLFLFLLSTFMISLDGIYKYRVFITALLPLLFVIIQNFYTTKYRFSTFTVLIFLVILVFCFSFIPNKFIILLLMIFSGYAFYTKFNASQLSYIICLFTMVFAMFLFDKLTWDQRNHAEKRKNFIIQQNLISQTIKQLNKSVFPLPKKFIIAAINPISAEKIPNLNHIIFSGWMAAYPDKIHTLESLGTLLEKSCFLISKSDQNRVMEVQQFVIEHYQKEYNAKIVLVFGDYCIVDFNSQDNSIIKIK